MCPEDKEHSFPSAPPAGFCCVQEFCISLESFSPCSFPENALPWDPGSPGSAVSPPSSALKGGKLSPGSSSSVFPEVKFLAEKGTWKGQLLSLLSLQSSLESVGLWKKDGRNSWNQEKGRSEKFLEPGKREMGEVLGTRSAGCDVTLKIPWKVGVDRSIPVFQARRSQS